MRRQMIAAMLALTLSASGLAACGDSDSSTSKSESSKEDFSAAYAAMNGEYVCTSVIVNVYGSDAGYEYEPIKSKYLDSKITLNDTTLTMDGKEFTMEAGKTDNGYYNYMVTIDGSGYDKKPHNSDRKFADSDFEGPIYFMFAAKGTDQGFGPIEKDTIEMYYSPAGTEDWYFSFTFEK